MAATLGQLIRQRRMALGLTQEELAERVGDGVRQAEISRLERDGVTLPRRARLEQIAAALDVPLGVLLARSGWGGAQEAFAPADGPASPEPSPLTDEEDLPEPPTEETSASGQPAPIHTGRPEREAGSPQLSDAITRARALSGHTESVIRQARTTMDEARRTIEHRRNGAGLPPSTDDPS